MGYEFLEGNEAIARGAMKAGCNFFAGYPITPASSILHCMLNWLPRENGMAIQAEDEIASIGLCLGAAMAGAKAMTATSGPGMSLYSENIGLAIMGETPIVIVDIQRQGPSTGSATKGAEGDIQFARWGTSGGIPIIALSPASVEEAYEQSYLAFNFAEKYRTPVFLLASKEIALTRERVDLDAIELPVRIERKRAKTDEPFVPHAFTEPCEVPPMLPMGARQLVRFTSSTHDETGYLTTDPAKIQRMIDHYTLKITAAQDDICRVRRDFESCAETLVVSYGITSRSAGAAVRKARAMGNRVSSLVLQTLWPVPEKAVKSAMHGMKRIVIPEMNMGQYALEIERLCPDGVELVGIHKMDSTLISPDEILGGILREPQTQDLGGSR